MKLFLVDAVSTFRNSYAVRAESAEHAADSVTMNEVEEFGQQWLGEQISRVMEISEEDYLKLFDADSEYLVSWTDEKKKESIHTIEYDKPYDPISSSKSI
jgi:hypothetical protein